jgi:uncharacterized protein YfaA (DUF2138 family)
MTRKDLVNKYANDIYDSIEWVEYIQFKVDYNKEDRLTIIGEDRLFSYEEYLDLADEVAIEFKNVVKDS